MVKSSSLAGTLVTTSRDTKHVRWLRVSSDERVSGTPYDFEVNFNDSKNTRIRELQLISASILNGFYNISASKDNNVFKVDIDASIYTLVIPDGFYTATAGSILRILQNFINANLTGDSIVMALDPANRVVSITKTGISNVLKFLPVSAGSTISKTLGLFNELEIVGAGANYFNAYPDLNGETMIYIHSSNITNNKTLISSLTADSSVNGFISIPLAVPFGFHQTYHGHHEDRIIYGNHEIGHQNLKKIRITLRGDGGRLLTGLPENHTTTLIFKVYYSISNP